MARCLPPVWEGVQERTVFNFLLGLAIGWLAGSWYTHNGAAALPVEEMRRKASRALEESERLVEESRRELQAAVMGKPPGRPKRPRRQRRQSEND
jgi:hypothetical protein